MRGPRLRTAAGLAALLLLSCDGGSGPPDPCPTGDCTLPGSTVVKFLFDSYPEWQFVGDTCIDMNISTVRADAVHVDDPSIVDTKDVQCGEGQVTFLGLPPGTYHVAVTPLDPDGNPLVHAPAVGQAVASEPGGRTEATVNVPYTAWTGTFTGTLLFRIAWAGKSCEQATPPVVMQRLELTAGGGVVSHQSDTGQRMDGTDPRPCRLLSEPFAQFVEVLPFGPASLLVIGHDAGGGRPFERRFETFVGAGKNNPTLTFDVVPPDAGIDGGVDGGVDGGADGGAADAPLD